MAIVVHTLSMLCDENVAASCKEPVGTDTGVVFFGKMQYQVGDIIQCPIYLWATAIVLLLCTLVVGRKATIKQTWTAPACNCLN